MLNLTEVGKMRLVSFLFIFVIIFSSSAQKVLQWEVYHPIKEVWMPFGEAGSVQEYLWHANELPDPFYGDNEKSYQWIEDVEWNFRSRFFLNEDFYKAKQLVLDIPNLDTYAQIYINGKLLAKTDNFFLKYRFKLEVSELNCGYNTIEIHLTPPLVYHQYTLLSNTFQYPAPNDVSVQKVAPLTRKPQYHFGWDWAPRINTIGFAYPISIDVAPQIKVENAFVNTLDISEYNDAHLRLHFELSSVETSLYCKSKYFGNFQVVNSIATSIDTVISNAKLWWPSGQGEQFLYVDTLRFYDTNGKFLLQYPYSFGMRKVELLQQKDEWGTSFAFKINGRPIFAKGANLIPPGIFAGQRLDSAYVALVPQMQAAHFNMVRIWGGGMYAPEAFMNACDKAGIMVWHDFMFACAMYPADNAFLNLVAKEAHQQVSRLAAHPSLVYFNGNNEVDVAWHNWGFQSQYKLDSDAQQEIESAYQKLFHQLLPLTIKNVTDNSIPYVHTSPLSNWGKDAYFNYGTMHYWGVWHGKDPITDFATKIGRFNAEYGFQSFPQPSTIRCFAPMEDCHLDSKVMKNHQKSYVGNGMIEKHAKQLYGKAQSFDQFIYFSQLTQRKAVSMAISGHRADAPRCMGTLYWQLNDCWPAPTWSSLDDQLNWKALQYAVKQDYRPIAVLEQFTKDGHYLILTNDLPLDTLVTIQMEFYDLNGGLKDVQRRTYPLTTNTTQVLTALSADFQGFVKVVLDENYERLFSFAAKRKTPDITFDLKIINIDTTLKRGAIYIENNAPLIDLWLYSPLQGLHFDDNFSTLLPGKHQLNFTYQDHLPLKEELRYLLR
jgi:beta-mannosidase